LNKHLISLQSSIQLPDDQQNKLTYIDAFEFLFKFSIYSYNYFQKIEFLLGYNQEELSFHQSGRIVV
jgi:hypothetical protein